MLLHNDLLGFALFIAFFIVLAMPPLLLKFYCNLPFELMRKMLHMIVVLSIFPLCLLFSTWYMAVAAALLLVVLAYPLLGLVEHSGWYKRVAVERESGEFKRSLIIVQLSIAILLFIFWGLLGREYQYIAVVAVMAWGFGDAAAALIGKAFGRRQIVHQRIAGKKTVEGTLAMYLVAALAVFVTLLAYAGQSWDVSLVVAVLVAPVCAAVELFSNRGMDTLTVPLSTALAILPLMVLFAYLGV